MAINLISLKCDHCGKIFSDIPSRADKRKCCSKYCDVENRKRRVAKTCVICGKKFEVVKSYLHRYSCCSKRCHLKHYAIINKGDMNPAWKGGRTIARGGYVWLKLPEHHSANHAGYVPEHRVILEKHLKRELLDEEDVHHINGDRQDNRVENLSVFSSRGEHIAHHWSISPERRSRKRGENGCWI